MIEGYQPPEHHGGPDAPDPILPRTPTDDHRRMLGGDPLPLGILPSHPALPPPTPTPAAAGGGHHPDGGQWPLFPRRQADVSGHPLPRGDRSHQPYRPLSGGRDRLGP